MNWDQTGMKIVPSASWTMDRCGMNRVNMTGERQITAVFCGTLVRACPANLSRKDSLMSSQIQISIGVACDLQPEALVK